MNEEENMTGTVFEDKKIKTLRMRMTLILAMSVITILMIILVSGNVRISMKDNYRKTLNAIAVRTTVNMERRYNRQWDYLEFVETNLQVKKYKTQQEIFRVMEVEREALGFAEDSGNMIFLIDDDGFYYSPDKGVIGLWNSVNTLFSTNSLKRGREISVNALAETDMELEEYLCFTKRMTIRCGLWTEAALPTSFSRRTSRFLILIYRLRNLEILRTTLSWTAREGISMHRRCRRNLPCPTMSCMHWRRQKF